MRILVKMDNDYRLLTLPAAYKMNYNGATWYYKFGKDLFEKLLVKYPLEDIYLMNFSPDKSQTKDIEKVFKLNPVYFYMRREEIYRMYMLSRKILQYTEKRKIDYYGTD